MFYVQSAKVDLDLWPPWPKINRVPPLIMANVHVNFESDCAKTVVAIVPTRFYVQSAKIDLDLWPRDPKSIGFLLSSWQCACEVWKWLGKNCSRYRVHKVKRDGTTHPPTYESDCAKTIVVIVPTRFYVQSAKVDLDLWPRDPKSIGFLLSWQMCMWILKVIGQKL